MREFIASLLRSPQLAEQIVHREEIPASAARFRDLQTPLSDPLRAAAARLGVDRLYTHQADAIELIRGGRDVAVVTPTASGKSLVNYLPTAEMLAEDGGHALYIFPHKALEQDQLKKLGVFGRGLYGARSLTAEIYDGDTPASRRRKIRAQPPDVLITNPEMLHLGLLAYHGEWARFFGSLRLIVIDELHVYRGVFGSHFAHVMRRLARVTAHYGSEPRYLVCSATIGNPSEFTRSLLGRTFSVVSASGAPQNARHFLFVNPAGSPYTAATRLFVEAVRAGLRTIAFTKARKVTELIHSWVEQAAPELGARIASYRAGYLPEERREIERRLFRGDLMGVIATSALELGIDVGGLDACILVGYPGSVMSSWQRIGRVGRQDRDSFVILVAQPDALDQYFMAHPRQFFERGFEPAVVDPSNPVVAGAHLVCAGAELPVPRSEAEAYAGRDGVEGLIAAGRLVENEARDRCFSLARRPQRDVSLRSGGESYAILAEERDRPIGTIDGVRVFHECHEGAIYLHGGTSYRIVRLDQESKRVLAVRFRGEYYTQALGSKETEILEVHRHADRGRYGLSLGRLKVTVRITEYARKRLVDQQTLSKHPLEVPPIIFETIGFWITLPEALEKEATRRELHFMGGLHASEHTMISLFPLLALCDRGDIGGISYSRNTQLEAPAIFIYDGYPGGIGLAASVHDRIEDLFRTTADLLRTCPCQEGCPSCVQSPKCGSGNRPLDKEAARLVLGHLMGEPEAQNYARSDPAAVEGPEARACARQSAGGAMVEAGARGLSAGEVATAGAAIAWEAAVRGAPGGAASASGATAREAAAGAATVRVTPSGEPTAGKATAGVARPGAAAAGKRTAGAAATIGAMLEPGEGPAHPPLAGPGGTRRSTLGADASEPARSGPAVGPAAFLPRPDEGRVLVFDLETQRSAEEVGGWSHVRDMKLALGVVLDVRRQQYTTYFEKDVERLVLDLVMADRVIGFNSERFDFVVLSGYGDWDLSRIRSFDMLKYIHERLGFRLKLGDLAEMTLQTAKSGDGLQSLAWYKEGRLDLIEEYCRRDVELTARLFFFGRERGYLLYRHRDGGAVRLKVAW